MQDLLQKMQKSENLSRKNYTQQAFQEFLLTENHKVQQSQLLQQNLVLL
jgi:hypothetical protein